MAKQDPDASGVLRAELSKLKLSELKRRARAIRVDPARLEAADDVDNIQEVVIELILEQSVDAAQAAAAAVGAETWWDRWGGALVVATVVCCYANALDGGWQVDDLRSFAGNRDVVGQLLVGPGDDQTTPGVRGDPYLPSSGLHSGASLPPEGRIERGPLSRLFSDDFWGEPMSSANSHKSYRPLTVLSFRLSYQLCGGGTDEVSRAVYHAENVGWHAVVCVLFLHAVRRLAGPSQPPQLAVAAAILFAAHAVDSPPRISFAWTPARCIQLRHLFTHGAMPWQVHVEAVTNVTGRAELLAAALFLGSVLAYPHPSGHEKFSEGVCPGRVVLATLFGLLAMLAKEPGVTALGLNVAMDSATTLLSPVRDAGQIRRLALRTVLVGILGVPALVARWGLNGGHEPRFTPGVNPASVSPDASTRMMTYAYVWARSYWLMLYPAVLSADWGYGSIPLVQSAADERNMATVVFFLTLIGSTCWSIRHRSASITAFWLGLLVLPFLPATNLCFRVGFVIAERVLYLPSLGFCLLVAVALFGRPTAPGLSQV
jgi:hypothetical protein